jgi:hypothetical protein
VKFFSGTATYSTTFTAPTGAAHSQRVFLHLDDVRDLAQTTLNGHPAGLVWAPPYNVDITTLLRPGPNKLSIAVTNEWTNRILGDLTLPPDQRILRGPMPPRFGPPPALPASGLTGHITLLTQTTRSATQ